MTKQLQLLISELESHIPDFEKTNPKVSNSTVGWQVDHSLIMVNVIIDQLKKSNPNEYKWRFNKLRMVFKIVNKFPRGKARAPKSVQPLSTASVEDLNTKVILAKKNLAHLESLPANSYFTHPIFGDLNLKQTIWFLRLHTKHHLNIIEDIIK